MVGPLDGPMTDVLAQPLVDVAPRGRGIRASVAISTDAASMSGLAALSGLLYLVYLTVSGYANTYYAMAAQAASQSWSAMFFGALDSQGFITIDKPPLATWVMGLSVKVLGLSSWSILLPEAFLGIGSVLVLYLAVRRSFGSTAALIAGALMAVTPVAVLIFRYDNPDALLTFLLVTAAWALGRGLERGRLRWALLAASLVGAAFLTKYLQAYLVLPAFALVWLVSAPVSLRRRLVGLVAAAGTVAVTSFWWVAIVELIPAGSRPYIGGSTTNSPLELLLGYDGLGRIFGNQPGGSGLGSAVDGLAFGAAPGGGGPTFSGTPGLFRLFNDQFAGQIAWLIPAALLALGVGIVLHLRTGRTDRRLAGYVLWGTWLAVHVVVFSFMSGIIHTYYAVILVPAIVALVGGASVELWRHRATDPRAGAALGVGIAMTGLLGFAILERTPAFAPGLAYGVLALSLAAALVLAIPAGLLGPRVPRVALAIAVVAVLAGPLAYATDTMATAYSGGDPYAGPQSAASIGGPGGNGPGGLGAVAATDQALVDYLVANQGSARWIVAASGSQDAAGIQLAAGLPVLTMGGFTGSDPTPTLSELQALVASGQVRYVLLGGGPGGGPGGLDGLRGPGGSGGTGDRTAWVGATCTVVSAAGLSSSGLYDCSGAPGGLT
jgi:4-amino-4-deoxy-L-arabinose transferase-like glycosyltransferase